MFHTSPSSIEGNETSAFVGRIPQDLLNEENSFIRSLMEIRMELVNRVQYFRGCVIDIVRITLRTLNFQENLSKVSKNGYRQYLKSRPNASTESNRRAKGIEVSKLPIHPIFTEHVAEDPMDTLISQMQNYRPNAVRGHN